MGTLGMLHWLFVLAWLMLMVVPLWRIVSRAGFAGPLSLLALVPGVNIVLLWVFAFIKWPVEDRSAQ